MIHRALIHVAGPPGAGKTTLIERLLDRRLAYASYVRGERVAELSREEESAPREHPELRRVRELGAGAVALYRFPCPDSEAFYCSDLMADYSEAVVIEGDCPVEWVDLSVFVAPAPQPGESLLRRIVRDHAAEHRASLDHYAAVLASPDRLASFLAQELGRGVAAMALRRPGGLDELHPLAPGIETIEAIAGPAVEDCETVCAAVRAIRIDFSEPMVAEPSAVERPGRGRAPPLPASRPRPPAPAEAVLSRFSIHSAG